jgi:hypothetical protein
MKEMAEMDKLNAQNRPEEHLHRKQRQDRGPKREKRGFNDVMSVSDAKDLGLNFNRNGPPRFKNDKKVENDAARQVTEIKDKASKEDANAEPEEQKKNYQIRDRQSNRGRGSERTRGDREGHEDGHRREHRPKRGGNEPREYKQKQSS